MSASNSPAETPDFAMAAETNTGSDNTGASASAGSVLTDVRSQRSELSSAMSWNLIQSMRQQQGNMPMVESRDMEMGERSRPHKRTELHGIRTNVASKSPRRTSDYRGASARGSRERLSAEERLDRLIAESRRTPSPKEREGVVGTNLVGSPIRESPVSPSMALQMSSPPRVLTTTVANNPSEIPITDITSVEATMNTQGKGRDPVGRDSVLSQEVVALTQERLTSEFEVAEMNNRWIETEARKRYLEQELSQEVHMFDEARALIEEMRRTFTIEDQGCIRRIEMLETQRNSYASELVEIGNQAESIMQQRSNQHNEEIHDLKARAEAYLGVQNEDISRLRNELADANSEMQRGLMNMEINIRNEKSIAHANEVLSSELLMSKTKLQQNETETSMLHNTLESRSSIMNSEIANLHSIIESQKKQQMMKSGFTEDEIMTYLLKKLSEFRNEYHQEQLTLQSIAQSEGDVARLYKGRYEDLTKELPGSESNSDSMVKALKTRLDNEKNYVLQQVSLRQKETDELKEVTREINAQKYENQKMKMIEDRLRKRIHEENAENQRIYEMRDKSRSEVHELDEKVAFLESETDRLRGGRDEYWAYSQELYEELWENENGNQQRNEENTEETEESAKAGSSESKSRISRREADKVIVPPWPKSHDLEGWKSQLISNVLSACADTDQEAWICWLGEAFRMNPDVTALGDSGGPRFTTIDVKLANALTSMIASSGDSGKEVGMDIKVLTLDLARKDPPGIIKGRQMIAMIMDSFRSSAHTDLAFTGKHLYEMIYPGDNKLGVFKAQWIHILASMREDDKPRGLALRDILYDKIKGSNLMAFDIQYYRKKPEGHPEKTYEYLMEMITRTISTEREEKNRLEKSKGIQQILGAKALAVEKTGKDNAKPDKNPKSQVDNSAAPVVAKAPPKTRPEPGKGKGKDGKGKGKGKGKDRSRERSSSADRKKIPCVFHFQKGGCSKGKDCQFSHSKKSLPRGSSHGPGKGKGDGKARTPSPNQPKSEKPCFLFAKGKCERAD